MCHIIVKNSGIESSVMAQDPIMRGQSVVDGRMVCVDGVGVEDEGEGEGMHRTILKIRAGKGIGLAADQNMKDIHRSEVGGMVSLILGGDRSHCVITTISESFSLKLLLSIW
jgi:hypothetical protein